MSEEKVNSRKTSGSLGEVPDALRRLLRAELELGRGLLASLLGSDLPSLGGSLLGSCGCGCGKSTCSIPPPCWLPQSLGDRTSHVSRCSTVCLELELDNCGLEGRRVKVAAKGDQNVTVSPNELDLGPLERGRVKVCVHVPDDAKTGSRKEVTVVVAGCKVHYLRWTISVGTFGLSTDHRVRVEDCPDYVHHWYDHFYCARPCGGRSAKPLDPKLAQAQGPLSAGAG